MFQIAASVTLYLVDPFGSLIFILLTGHQMYDPVDEVYVFLAMLFVGIVRRFIQRSS